MLEKYNISDTLQTLGERERQTVRNALQQAEQFIPDRSHWQVGLCGALLVGVLALGYLTIHQRQQLAEQSANKKTAETILKIDQTLAEVQRRQQEVYPVLQEQQQRSIQEQQRIRTALTSMTKITPAPFRARASSMTLQELSKELLGLGYPNRIVEVQP
jgi:ElaB/YqjD/DUF883 family membrane-anchored ribosome-binding protein